MSIPIIQEPLPKAKVVDNMIVNSAYIRTKFGVES